MKRFTGFAVCTDCHLTAAGYSAHELGHTPDLEPLALIQGYAICEGELTTYGTADCEGCGSALAGARYAVTADRGPDGCPACGQSPAYCLGHGEIGDPNGADILASHDDDQHGDCHRLSACQN